MKQIPLLKNAIFFSSLAVVFVIVIIVLIVQFDGGADPFGEAFWGLIGMTVGGLLSNASSVIEIYKSGNNSPPTLTDSE